MGTKSKTLNPLEKNIVLPIITEILRNQVGIENAISCQKIKGKLEERHIDITKTRVKAIITQIRVDGEVKRLIATPKGFYVSKIYEELPACFSSLQDSVDFMIASIQTNLDIIDFI